MKTLYTILFFSDTFLLTVLSYLFFEKLDTVHNGGSLSFLLSGIILSIILLVLILVRYIRLPRQRH